MEGFSHDYTCDEKEKISFWQSETMVLLLPSIQSILGERLFPFSVIKETWEKDNKSRHCWSKILHVLDCSWRLIFGAHSEHAVCSWQLQRWLFFLASGGGCGLLLVSIIWDNPTSTHTSLTPHSPRALCQGQKCHVCHQPPRKEGWPREMAAWLIPNPSPKGRGAACAAGRGNPKATETVRPEVFPSVFTFLIPL